MRSRPAVALLVLAGAAVVTMAAQPSDAASRSLCEKTAVESLQDNAGIIGTFVGGPNLRR